MNRLNNRGDTIIEVVLSMALLTSILFTAWSITNRSTQIMSAARDRTFMVNQVKEQAEIIKNQWEKSPEFLSDANFPAAVSLEPNPCEGRGEAAYPIGGSERYIAVDQATNELSVNTGVKRADGDENKGVWVQKVERVPAAGNPNDPGATDFYVRACWLNNSGSNQKLENTQVLVRLSK